MASKSYIVSTLDIVNINVKEDFRKALSKVETITFVSSDGSPLEDDLYNYINDLIKEHRQLGRNININYKCKVVISGDFCL